MILDFNDRSINTDHILYIQSRPDIKRIGLNNEYSVAIFNGHEIFVYELSSASRFSHILSELMLAPDWKCPKEDHMINLSNITHIVFDQDKQAIDLYTTPSSFFTVNDIDRDAYDTFIECWDKSLDLDFFNDGFEDYSLIASLKNQALNLDFMSHISLVRYGSMQERGCFIASFICPHTQRSEAIQVNEHYSDIRYYLNREKNWMNYDTHFVNMNYIQQLAFDTPKNMVKIWLRNEETPRTATLSTADYNILLQKWKSHNAPYEKPIHIINGTIGAQQC